MDSGCGVHSGDSMEERVNDPDSCASLRPPEQHRDTSKARWGFGSFWPNTFSQKKTMCRQHQVNKNSKGKTPKHADNSDLAGYQQPREEVTARESGTLHRVPALGGLHVSTWRIFVKSQLFYFLF